MAPFCASKALEFDFDADLDADSAFENYADPDSQPWFFNYICAFFFRHFTVCFLHDKKFCSDVLGAEFMIR
jgi:hypothetical protein